MTLSKIFSNVLKLLVKYKSAFRSGVWMTIKLSVITVFFGLIFGSVIALMKLSDFHIWKIKPLNILSTIYVEVIRGTPLLLQLYFFYFLIPQALPFLGLDKIKCVLIALIFNSAGYVAEIIRAGIMAVDPGQTEAARSLGLNARQTLFSIVLPQAVKNILPAMGNELVMMFKETALASTFFVGEITTQSNIVGGATFLQIEAIIISGIFYLMLTLPLGRLISIYEKRLKVSD